MRNVGHFSAISSNCPGLSLNSYWCFLELFCFWRPGVDDMRSRPCRIMTDECECVTSEARHSLTLSGSPPHDKLLIPFDRRDGRVVEGARLESVCRGNSTEGSNPSLSAKLRFASFGGASGRQATPR